MILNLTRTTTTKDAILGELSVDGGKECYTLENRDLCIPCGTYSIEIYDSPHAGHLLPILRNVPDREMIEIHCGNVSVDSKGCILVGKTRTADSVLGSRLAFDHLFPQIQQAIEAGDSVTIKIA